MHKSVRAFVLSAICVAVSFYLYLEHDSGNGQDQLSVYIDDDRVFKVKG